jgi:hypothetical protein
MFRIIYSLQQGKALRASEQDYLFMMYIVTSNPKRISVAAGFVHMVILLVKFNVIDFSQSII